jgi:hypothetical protein
VSLLPQQRGSSKHRGDDGPSPQQWAAQQLTRAENGDGRHQYGTQQKHLELRLCGDADNHT